MTLDRAVSGNRYVITKVLSQEADRRHLFTLGFTEGQPITCLYTALAGDPVAFDVQGTTIALRRNQLKTIWAVPLECDTHG